MDWLRHLKIGVKLSLGISVMTVLIIITGFIGYRSTKNVQKNVEDVLTVRLPSLDYVIEADRDLHQLLVAQSTMFFTDANSPDFQPLVDTYEENLRQSKERWEKFKALSQMPEEAEIFPKYEQARERWKVISRKIVEDCQEGSEERRVGLEQVMAEAKVKFEEMRDYLDQLTDLNLEYAGQANEAAESTYRTATLNILAGIIVSLLIGVFLIWTINQGVTKPLTKITDVAKSVASGNLDSKIEIVRHDEIGQLASAFQDMSHALRTKAEAAEQIALGNLNVDVTVLSQEDVLGKSMLTMKESLQDMQQDLHNTIEAQKVGNLEMRCHPEKFTGAYAEILKGINDALDAVIQPLLEGIDIIEQYAKGNLSTEMHDLPGKQIVLTESLNGIRHNLRALIEEGLGLATAAEKGNLQTRGNTDRFEGSYREVIQSINNTIENMVNPVNEVVDCLTEMARGNLAVSVSREYQGDHARMKDAMNSTLKALNNTISQIVNTADQFVSVSKQVSANSQSLSQGATEQAGSLQQITASLSNQGARTKQNADSATQAQSLATSAHQAANEGNKQMKQMLKAMSDIDESSGDISRIIKVIDEIAFQTNLLALNAAVEAARAGVHGKGFAVVAEEVRNLAQRSSKAAKETTELIEGSVRNVKHGTEIADKTAKSLEQIVQGVTKVNDLVGEIAAASNEQDLGLEQVNQNLSRVDHITNANTESALQSAAAAEELFNRANALKEMLVRFQLAKQHSEYIDDDFVNPGVQVVDEVIF